MPTNRRFRRHILVVAGTRAPLVFPALSGKVAHAVPHCIHLRPGNRVSLPGIPILFRFREFYLLSVHSDVRSERQLYTAVRLSDHNQWGERCLHKHGFREPNQQTYAGERFRSPREHGSLISPFAEPSLPVFFAGLEIYDYFYLSPFLPRYHWSLVLLEKTYQKYRIAVVLTDEKVLNSEDKP